MLASDHRQQQRCLGVATALRSKALLLVVAGEQPLKAIRQISFVDLEGEGEGSIGAAPINFPKRPEDVFEVRVRGGRGKNGLHVRPAQGAPLPTRERDKRQGGAERLGHRRGGHLRAQEVGSLKEKPLASTTRAVQPAPLFQPALHLLKREEIPAAGN
ncbi:MAG TPA: hypothetical protein VIY71_10730 [Solirubrobacterales bacterium]